MLTTALIEQVLAALPHTTIGLLGDLFLDRYLDLDPARDEPSVETGLTAYQVTRVRSYPGALGTVLNNLAALGVGRIVPIAILGDDGEGYELRQALARIPAVDPGGLITTPNRRTPTYTKPMYGTKELNRLDIKNRTPTPAALEDEVITKLDELWGCCGAWIVLDQVSEVDCGVVTQRVRERLAEWGERDPARFVLADSREQIGLFRNVCVKPNERELAALVSGLPTVDGLELLIDGIELIGRSAFVTAGADGIGLYQPRPEDGSIVLRMVAGYTVAGPVDICGAGDSCSAGITSAVAAGLTYEQAAAFGNLVASVTVQQIGTTGTASPEQVRARWAEVQPAVG